LFEYGSWEAQLKKSKTPGSGIGKWKKNGKTIVWQDGPDGRLHRPTSAPSVVDDDETNSSLYSWFLGGRGPSFFSSNPSSSSSTGGGAGYSAYSPPGKRYMSYGDETRWREGIF